MYEGGLEKMRWSISEVSAEWGDTTSPAPSIITDATKAEMKKVLAEIQDGTFAKNWMDEYHGGLKRPQPRVQAAGLRAPAGATGELRKLVSWVDEGAYERSATVPPVRASRAPPGPLSNAGADSRWPPCTATSG